MTSGPRYDVKFEKLDAREFEPGADDPPVSELPCCSSCSARS